VAKIVIKEETKTLYYTFPFPDERICLVWKLGPEETLLEHQKPVSTEEFLHSIAFPQQKTPQRLSTG